MRQKERQDLKHCAYQNVLIDKYIPLAVQDLKQRVCGMDFVFDLNAVIKRSEESLFTNHWIHCNAKGNKMIAQKVVEILKQKGAIG